MIIMIILSNIKFLNIQENLLRKHEKFPMGILVRTNQRFVAQLEPKGSNSCPISDEVTNSDFNCSVLEITEHRVNPKMQKLKTKIGIDAPVIVSIIKNPEALWYLVESNVFTADSGLCICRKNLERAKDILMTKYDYAEEDALNSVNTAIKDLNIDVLDLDPVDFSLANSLLKKYAKHGLCEPDNFILACLIRNQVEIFYTTNNALIKAAREAGINPRKFPTREEIRMKKG